ncbi:MAG: penicillin-binding protein 1C [Verrucomicrobia bacterium]|nr:MAG: penicillin-binding protein 1C [Verrucomicrobiota bacterium]
MKPMGSPKAKSPLPAGRKRRRRRWRWLGAVVIVLGLAAVAGWKAIDHVPLPADLFEPPPPPLAFLDRYGRPLRQLRDGEGFVSRPVRLKDVPQTLIDATIAAEDKRFWRHPGVDVAAILRATAQNLWHRRVVSGASTITQQLIKNVQPRPRTIRAKVIEALQALKLERVWTKEQILEAYLNRIDYGRGNRGVAAAAEAVFDRPVGELTLGQAALLAGLPQAPSRHDPWRHPSQALKRRRFVLDRMLANHWIDPTARDQAAAEPLRLAAPARRFRAPHFVDFLLQRELTRPSLPATGRVRTTIDLEIQTAAEQALRARLADLAGHNVRHGAVVVLDNRTGAVRALVGSPDYRGPVAGQVNGAWAARSAGSTLKPFTYALAFEQGASPADVLPDVPSSWPTRGGVFAPVNYDRRFHGPVRLRLALANSYNVPAVRLLDAIGGPAVLWRKLRECGLGTLEREPEFYGLGLTIGNAEVRLLELVNAYACLARLGVWRPWRLLEDEPFGQERRLFSAAAAWMVADVLDDDAARSAEFGHDSPLALPFPVACKTGTSSDFRDNWAVGYTPEFTVGVWVGNFDGSPMREISGISGAGPVLRDVFLRIHRLVDTTWYRRPPEVAEGWVHPLTGHRVQPPAHHARDWRNARDLPPARWAPVREVFWADRPPPAASPEDFDAEGRVRLGPEYAEWLAGQNNPLAGLAVVRRNDVGLRILWPVAGTVIFLDPDLPDDGRKLRLQAAGPDRILWSSPSLEIHEDDEGAWARLEPGRHTLTAKVGERGPEATTWIEVRRW